MDKLKRIERTLRELIKNTYIEEAYINKDFELIQTLYSKYHDILRPKFNTGTWVEDKYGSVICYIGDNFGYSFSPCGAWNDFNNKYDFTESSDLEYRILYLAPYAKDKVKLINLINNELIKRGFDETHHIEDVKDIYKVIKNGKFIGDNKNNFQCFTEKLEGIVTSTPYEDIFIESFYEKKLEDFYDKLDDETLIQLQKYELLNDQLFKANFMYEKHRKAVEDFDNIYRELRLRYTKYKDGFINYKIEDGELVHKWIKDETNA